jgi:hypothetical protein
MRRGRGLRLSVTKGEGLRAALLTLAVAMAMTGCSSLGGAPAPTPVPTATERAVGTHPYHSTPLPTVARSVAMSPAYQGFLKTLCGALTARDATTLRGQLAYYQYNSGLRYGALGDGEGTTGDPALLTSWLASAPVHCALVTPDIAGHGTVLTRGWASAPGPWSLIEMDTYSGTWKINDFTFGRRPALYAAMQNSPQPIEAYRG